MVNPIAPKILGKDRCKIGGSTEKLCQMHSFQLFSVNVLTEREFLDQKYINIGILTVDFVLNL